MQTEIISEYELEKAKQTFLDNSKIASYDKYNLIIRANTIAKDLFFIVEGRVSIFTKDEDSDKTLIIGNLGEGDFVGEMGLFNENNLRSAWVEAKTAKVVVAYMPYQKFLRLSQEHSNLWQLLTKQLSSRLHQTSKRYRNLAFLGVAGRISNMLLDMAKTSEAIVEGKHIVLKVNRMEIARTIGCSREMVGKVLNDLELEGIIENHSKYIVLSSERLLNDLI